MTMPETPDDDLPASHPGVRSPRIELLIGLGSGLGVSAGFLAVCLVVIPFIAVFGAIQLAWMWPLAAYFKGKSRPIAARGVWLASALIFLLSGACWGTVLLNVH